MLCLSLSLVSGSGYREGQRGWWDCLQRRIDLKRTKRRWEATMVGMEMFQLILSIASLEAQIL